MLKNKTIVIVGLGLMGASLALALRKKFPRSHITGFSSSKDTLRKAKRSGIIQSGSTEAREVIPGADFVVLATPLSIEAKKILEIDRFAKPGLAVTDMGSVKGKLIQWSDKQKFKNIHFVGSHPMAGSHHRGLGAARPDLFQHSTCFVVKSKKTNLVALKKVIQFWKLICARIEVLDARTHDAIVARISHLPHVLASLLVKGTDSKSLNFAGPGFRDTTRISQGDPGLWEEIISENSPLIEKELKIFRKDLDHFLACLRRGNRKKIFQILSQASRQRRNLS